MVAIIAILAAIAVPNFLEAQVRAKVSRAKSDLRSLALGVEMNALDNNNKLFVDGNDAQDARFKGMGPEKEMGRKSDITGYIINSTYHHWTPLTTPIAYLSSVLVDAFSAWVPYAYETWPRYSNTLTHVEIPFCMMTCARPDRARFPITNYYVNNPGKSSADYYYDPSNGTISPGDMIRVAAIKDSGVAKFYCGPSFDPGTK